RFLTDRGWKYVTDIHSAGDQLNRGHAMCGLPIASPPNLEERVVTPEQRFQVASVESIGMAVAMYDITTGTGDFIANGVVSHNCYARPSHEYLGLGAGTDFDRKITVKPDAPKLLREAFERPSWKGELIVFSGVTDCYQPLEASYRLTRG